jgi:hypothetical protein
MYAFEQPYNNFILASDFKFVNFASFGRLSAVLMKINVLWFDSPRGLVNSYTPF